MTKQSPLIEGKHDVKVQIFSTYNEYEEQNAIDVKAYNTDIGFRIDSGYGFFLYGLIEPKRLVICLPKKYYNQEENIQWAIEKICPDYSHKEELKSDILEFMASFY